MANYIRVPLKDTSITTASGPSYGVVNVEDVYDVEAASSDEHIIFYTDIPTSTGKILETTIEYYANGGGTTVVTAQDLENLRNLILSANQNPGSNPIFSLIGEATAAAADLEDYQVEQIGVGEIAPI